LWLNKSFSEKSPLICTLLYSLLPVFVDMRPILITFFLLSSYLRPVFAQDPHFSQFFNAPHYINPALTGTQYGDWCIMGNFRQQWGNAATPFNTQSLSFEQKFLKEDNENILAIGVSMMNDQTMNGAFRSVYASGTLAYHQNISDNSNFALGFLGSYNNRRLDYSKLTFGEQFSSGGFDLALPNGETNLSNLKPYFSLGTGLMYTYFSNYNDFILDIGFSAYDINQPRLSFLNDENNKLYVRYAGNLNAQYYPSEKVRLNFFSVYHRQGIQNYFSVGGSIGRNLGLPDHEVMTYLGAWFREGDAVYPYLGFSWDNVQVGLTYDIVISKQNLGPVNPQVFELSFVYTKNKRSSIYDQVGCPNWNRIVRNPTSGMKFR